MKNFILLSRRMRTVAHLGALGAAALAWSCAASEGTDSPARDGSPSASTGGGGSSGPEITIGGSLSLPGENGASSGATATCHAQVREGQRVPIDMYLLVDSSGSMAERVGAGTKWEVVSTALTAFLNDPRNEGTGVGLGYFPAAQAACMQGDPGCFCIPFTPICFSLVGGSCTVSDYSTAAVPLALPAQLTTAIGNLAAHQLGGGTPTRPALEGALQSVNAWATQHPDRKAVLVLATDGEPSGCDPNTPQDVADVAASALAGPHAIRTFVIGVGSSLVSLNLVAKAGGTDHAFLVDTGGDVAKDFADALDQIRGAASSCDFTIPRAGSGAEKIDPTKVNVSYGANGGGAMTRVPQTFMGDGKNCDSNGGWYYDDPAAPTVIKLCDATCRSLSGSAIQVEFGCDTVVRPPH
jgi:Mg-chelatase subunit ChlD